MLGTLIGRAPSTPIADPYNLVPAYPKVTGGSTNQTFPDWDNPNGKTPVDVSTLVNPIVGVFYGQSLNTNCVSSTYTPTGGTAYEFSITNGGCYVAKDPLMGCTGYHPNLPSNPWPTGSWQTRWPDKVRARGITRPVIIVQGGVGGSNARDWQSGGGNNARFAVTKRRLDKAGLTASFIYWQQGESNTGDTQVAYATALSSIISGIRAQWSSTPLLIAISTYINDATDANVAAAQAAAVDNPALIYAGANGDTLTWGGGYRQSDKTHWNATGADAYAGLADTALHNAGVY